MEDNTLSIAGPVAATGPEHAPTTSSELATPAATPVQAFLPELVPAEPATAGDADTSAQTATPELASSEPAVTETDTSPAAQSVPAQAPMSDAELELALATQQLSVRDAVIGILENAVAHGRPVPSIRAIQGRIGKGSLGTLSGIVKKWKLSRLRTEKTDLQGFTEDDGKEILEALWRRVLPMIARQVEAVEADAEHRIAIEVDAAAKLQEAADDVLAAADRREARIRELERQLAAAESRHRTELQQAKEQVAGKDAELADVRRELDAARQTVASLTAEMSSMRALLPFLDPKFVGKADAVATEENGQHETPGQATPADADTKREKPKEESVTTAEPEQDVTPSTQGEQDKTKTRSRSKSGRAKAKQSPLVPDGQ